MTQTTTLRVLIVDDEPNVRFALRETLEPMGFRCEEAADGTTAVTLFKAGQFDLVLLDYRMPGLNGIEVLREIHSLDEEVPIIFVTAYGSRELALEALQEGAYDYFTKPFDLGEMRAVVRRAMERRLLGRKLEQLSVETDPALGFDRLIGSTWEMREIYRLIRKVAPQDVTVLVLGESGTGKELIASAIHRHSSRSEQPFVPINCAAIPANLLESELFGHEQGSFTGATAKRTGKFEYAQGGTLFLDEIGDMDALLQAKLLRVLQERQFQRVGGNQNLTADVRIVAATNCDLAKEVAQGNFREDLFFRLNVISIYLPPLRERREDLPLLVEHFLQQAAEKYQKEISGIAPELMERLFDHHWPGNIRELENVITRAVVLSHGPILTPADLPMGFLGTQTNAEVQSPIPSPENIAPGQPGSNYGVSNQPTGSMAPHYGSPDQTAKGSGQPFGNTSIADCLQQIEAGLNMQQLVEREVDAFERALIQAALARNQDKRGQTAEFLGISRRNLLRKMQKLEID